MKKYWTNENQKSILKYFFAITKEEKERIFNTELYNPIYNLAVNACYRFSQNIDEDIIQEALIKIATYTLPRLQQEKLLAAHNYIYTAINRVILTHYQKKTINPSYYSTCTSDVNYTYTSSNESTKESYIIDNAVNYYSTVTDSEAFNQEETNIIRKQILDELDKKIEAETVLNKKTTLFLILLKQYTIDNNFDVRGFRSYVCNVMGIKKTNFSNLCSTLKIVNSDFRKEIIDNSKTVNYKLKVLNTEKQNKPLPYINGNDYFTSTTNLR